MRTCKECEKPLKINNPGRLCPQCQDERLNNLLDDPNEPLGTKHIALIMGVTPIQVRRWREKGITPPHLPFTGRYRWDRDVFIAWKESGYPAISKEDKDEYAEAILYAIGKGWPVGEMTSYGYDKTYLIQRVREDKELSGTNT